MPMVQFPSGEQVPAEPPIAAVSRQPIKAKGTLRARPALIGIDWGTSTLRAYLLADNGQLLDQVTCPAGILTVVDGDFATVLRSVCATWIKQWPALPVLMCGMIGSRQGWREVPYLNGEIGAAELAAGTMPVEGGHSRIRIIPGMQARSFVGGHDVMRGEETLLMGALASGAPQTAIYCLPGTHSKWVAVSDGRIGLFSTFLTGELFALLSKKSILSTLITDVSGDSEDLQNRAFRQGLAMASGGADLLHKLFSIRAQFLVGDERESDVAQVLSGLLIGTELMSMSTYLQQCSGKIVLLASGTIAERYRVAIEYIGYQPIIYAAEAACMHGLGSIAQQLDLIPLTETVAAGDVREA